MDPEGPELITYRVEDGVFIEHGRHSRGAEVTLEVGPTTVTFDPGRLLG